VSKAGDGRSPAPALPCRRGSGNWEVSEFREAE